MSDDKALGIKSSRRNRAELVLERRLPFVNRFVRAVFSPITRESRVLTAWKVIRYDVKTRLFKRTSVVPIGKSSKIIAYPGETNSPHAAYRNPPNPREMYVWEKHLKPGDLFVDVGSNIGIYTIFALDLGAEVIAFEPDPHNYERLQEHLTVNSFIAETHNVAVADQPGELHFTQGLDSYNHLALEGGDNTISVPVVTLDNVIGDRHVNGMKIDVEGAERLVLEGARNLIANRQIDLIQVEWSADQVTETLGEQRSVAGQLLADAGYVFHHTDNSGGLHKFDDWNTPTRRDLFVAPRLLS